MKFDQAPYYDDFDEFKNYHRILFKPGVAVQTREMNQLQSILQNQITKFGNHMFREGSMVIPGEVSYNDKLKYLKLQSYSLGTDADGNTLTLQWLEGKVICTGADGTGVRARVIKAIDAAGSDPDTLVLLYVSGNQTPDGVNTDVVFPQSTTLYTEDDDGTVYTTKVVTSRSGADYSGRSVAATIQSGVYYLGDYFVSVTSDVISVKTYADTVTDINARIGLEYTDSIVTSDDDANLYDNSYGSPNYAAPGANRYKITPVFAKYDLDATPENFFELIRVQEGVLQNLVNSSQYNILEDTLARRTYDESGNYTVNEFRYELREARANNQGTWTGTKAYQVNDFITYTFTDANGVSTTRYFVCVSGGISATGTTPPSDFSGVYTDETTVISDGVGSLKWRLVTNPISNRGLSVDGSTSNLVANFGIGKAYVQGYEINKITNSSVTIPKARTTRTEYNKTTYTPIGNYTLLDKTISWGIPDISTAPVAFLYDRTVGSRSGETVKFGHGQKVGTARVNWVNNDGRGALKLGLTDIKMNANKGFDRDVNSVVIPVDPTSTTLYTTSYTLTGTIRYTGYNAASYMSGSGLLYAPLGSVNTNITVTGSGTFYTQEFVVGDSITIGSAAYTSSWVIQSIASNTQMVIKGSPFLATVAGSSVYVSLGTSTVLGIGGAFGTSTRFGGELRQGDQLSIGGSIVSVTNVLSDNRMIVSSTALTAITSPGQTYSAYYAGQAALFAGDTFSNYAYGINARKLTGLYTLTDFSGAASTIGFHAAVRITGLADAKLVSELSVNDLVSINNNKLFITKISSNTVAYGICLDNQIVGSTSATYPAFRINNNLQETTNNKLVFPVVDATSSLSGNLFTAYKVATVTSNSQSATTINIGLAASSTPDAAETIATYDPTQYLVAPVATTTGLVPPYTVTNVSVVGQVITLTIAAGLSNAQNLTVVFPVNRGASAADLMGRRKSKTLTYSAYDDYLTSAAAVKSTLQLSQGDIYKLVRVFMASSFVGSWNTSTTQSTALDVTGRYELDDGQRDGAYELGKLKLKPGFPNPTGSIRVYYDYFTHSSGDFFSRGSYDGNQLTYESIPSYQGLNLGDALDFRAKVTNATTLTVTGQTVPNYGSNFIATTAFYLGRKDRIYLDRSATFYNVQGVSELNPKLTNIAENSNAINLYNLELKPYTKSAEFPDVLTQKIDNRRYTMKDIGSIEKRVSTLEQTTALSLLESKTKGLQIRDNLDRSLERYKTGFFVDNFSDASNADSEAGSRFSIDFDNQILYPSIEYHTFPLIEKLNYSAAITSYDEETPILAARESANYAINSDLLTLKFTTSTVLKQTIATTSISVAPYAKLSFLGNLKIVPDSDIYTITKSINKIIASTSTNTAAEAIASYRATRNWRPYHLVQTTVNVPAGTNIDIDLIPFCRANTIVMMAKGLKPNTKYYTFFDDEDVREFVTGATKLTFDSLPVYNFENIRPSTKLDWPRFRSLHESDETEEVARVKYRALTKTLRWVYDALWFRRIFNPKTYHKYLPSAAYRDGFRNALGIGAAVWCYEGGRPVGSGVAVYQDVLARNVYVVNGRGKLSPEYIRAQGTAGENFSAKTFYIGSNGVTDVRKVSQTVTAANNLTDDTDGFLYSDSNGVICAIFDLPNTETVRFLTGKKPLVITDSETNDPDDWTSKAEAFYTVEGWNVLITHNYISTKSFSARPYDPIAQSFKLPTQYQNGAFITDVDFFFQAKPVAQKAPVVLEIRTCDSTGRPSATEILPGTEVIKYPADINANDTMATAFGQTPTNFKFKQPVYLMPDKNYALVLRTDSPQYRVWMATLGQSDVYASGTTNTYSTQATLGSLFKSQDGTLWTEDQFSDLKFNINRAVFPTNTVATARVVNHSLAAAQLPMNPFTFVHGSNKVRVGLRNHGYASGDTVSFTSEYWRTQYNSLGATTIKGIPLYEIFGAYITSTTVYGGVTGLDYQPGPTDPVLNVEDVTVDTFTITTTTPAYIASDATTGITSTTDGGDDIYGHTQNQFHVITPKANLMTFKPTTLNLAGSILQGFTYDTNDGSAPDGGALTYQYINKELNFNQGVVLNTSCIVLNSLNEQNRNAGTSVAGTVWKDSFIGTITMSTEDDAVSPVVDLSTLNIEGINHRIDNPGVTSRLLRYGAKTLPAPGSTGQVVLITQIASANTTIGFVNSSTVFTTTANLFANIVPGRYVYVSGSAVSANNNTTTGWLVTSLAADNQSFTVSGNITSAAAGSPISIFQYDDFTEEITYSDGSSESKFVTRKINLANQAAQIKLLIESSVPSAADFDIYYKIGSITTDFNTLLWNKYVEWGTATSSYSAIAKTETHGDFSDVEIDINAYDSLGNPEDLSPFTAFQIKIVMRTSNAARVPQFRNLRVIAHA